MKYYLILFLGLTTLIGCGGSGKIVVEEMSRDNSFNSNDFLNGKISIYSPYTLNYPSQKYPDISKEELTKIILNQVKDKLEAVSDNSDIKIENCEAPDYFRGLKLNPESGKELLRKTDADYLLIIQSVTIGNTITKQKKDPPRWYTPEEFKPQKINPVLEQEKYTTKKTTATTIFFDIWDVKKGTSVLSISSGALLVDGINHKNPYRSIDKATSALAEHIKDDKQDEKKSSMSITE